MTEPRQYVRIEPARERADPADIIARIAGLRKLRTGWRVKWDPRKGPPTFEFLALTQGEDAPVRFYLGVDDQDLLSTVQSEMQTAYPTSYEIYTESVDLRAELCGQRSADERAAESDGQPPGVRSADQVSLGDRTPVAARWQGVGDRTRDWMTPIKQYSQGSGEGEPPESAGRAPLATAVERLAEASAPTAFQVLFTRYGSWQRAAEGRKKQIQTKHDGALQSARTSLGDLLYGRDTERIRDRRRGRDPPRVGESTQQVANAASGEVASRQALIDQKGPSQTFLVNLRAVATLPPEPSTPAEARVEDSINALSNAFNHLDGYFYHLEGSRLTRGLTDLRHPARKELSRLVSRQLAQSSFGKRRPQLVLNADELANFVAVPSAQALTTEGSRGARGNERLRQPLPLPEPELLSALTDTGMAVGRPMRTQNETLETSVRIPPDLLTTSYIRAASTGSGKSKAVQNELLSLDADVPGPTVLLEGKGDGMVENYLRAHFAKHGNLDAVYYFDAPETLPAVSFFDIRPALAAGRSREDAVQDKVEHFHEIMRLILGEERHEQAYVANEILTFLIKALFDCEYGANAFSLEELIEAVSRMSRERTLPEVCEANSHIEQSLLQKCQVDDRQFQQTMGAAANRLDKLVEHEYLYQLFTHVPEWDADAAEYLGNAFDFREFVHSDAVILFDLGEFRPESQHALTMILLSNLWDAVQGRRGGGQSLTSGDGAAPSDEEPIVNMVIEEAAPVATSSLVYEQFIPQGRAFGVSLGLILQYPEQVAQYGASDRAYTELLNNVKTKLIGNIATDEQLAASMAHENLSTEELRNRVTRLPPGEWIVQVPSPEFGETPPAPFSVASLPIPDGHPESDRPLIAGERKRFLEEAMPQVRQRTRAECSLPRGTGERDSATPPQSNTGVSGPPATAVSSSGETAGAGTAGEGDEATPFFGAADREDEPEPPAADPEPSGVAEETTGSPVAQDVGPPPTFGPTAESDSAGASISEPDLSAGSAPAEESSATDESSVPDQASSRLEEPRTQVSDEAIQAEGLTRDDVVFLEAVLDAMNRELRGYSLLDSMTQFATPFDELDVERLTDRDFLEAHRAFRQKYYTVLPAGREFLDRSLTVGPGIGDLGEKTPHKAGVAFLEAWLQQQQAEVHQTERYFEAQSGTVFDVAGFDATGELVWVGEVETASHNRTAVRQDYEKLAAADATAVWAFENREVILDVVETLDESDHLSLSLTATQRQTVSALRAAIAEQDFPGLATLSTFRSLKSEVNTEA